VDTHYIRGGRCHGGDCEGGGLRNETWDHRVTASGRQARDLTLSGRGAVSTMLIQEHTTTNRKRPTYTAGDSWFALKAIPDISMGICNGNMQGWADVMVHAGSNGREQRVELPGEMTGRRGYNVR
jgi:hypothetical protein